MNAHVAQLREVTPGGLCRDISVVIALFINVPFSPDDVAGGAQTLINGRRACTLRSANIPVSLAPDVSPE